MGLCVMLQHDLMFGTTMCLRISSLCLCAFKMPHTITNCHYEPLDQLYVKETCCTAWGKWWSLQTLFWVPPQYCDQSKAHLCNNHTNKHINMALLWSGMDYLSKGKVHSIIDLERFAENIRDKLLFMRF